MHGEIFGKNQKTAHFDYAMDFGEMQTWFNVKCAVEFEREWNGKTLRIYSFVQQCHGNFNTRRVDKNR